MGSKLKIAILSIAHFLVCMLLIVYVFGRAMTRFDTLTEPGWVDSGAGIVLGVLTFPLNFFLEVMPADWLPGLWGYIPFVLNSILWGMALFHVVIFGRVALSKGEVTSE